MKRGGKQAGVIAAGVIAAGIVAAGCGHGHQATTTTAPSSSSSSSVPESTTATTAAGDPVARGRTLVAQLPCLSCHSTTGEKLVGPTWKGLAGSTVQLSDGHSVVADRDYLVRSVEDPDAQIVQGFQKGVMSAVVPPGLVNHNDAEAIAAYIETLPRVEGPSRPTPPAPARRRHERRYADPVRHSVDEPGAAWLSPTTQRIVSAGVEAGAAGAVADMAPEDVRSMARSALSSIRRRLEEQPAQAAILGGVVVLWLLKRRHE